VAGRNILISANVDEDVWTWRKLHGLPWRFIIGKGIEHLRECVPREREIAAKYDQVLRASRHARLMHILKEKYPTIYNEVLDLDTKEAI